MVDAIHVTYSPTGARTFAQPLVAHLVRSGISCELWYQDLPGQEAVHRQISVPSRLVDCRLTLVPWRLLSRLLRLRRMLRAAAPRILHAQQTLTSMLPLLAARLVGVPVRIYHNQGLPYLGYRGPLRWLLLAIEHINCRLATHVLLVSRSNQQAAWDDGLLPPGRGEVMGHGSVVGIDDAEFAPGRLPDAGAARAGFGIAAGGVVFGYVGRPVRRKGFHLLLEAWRDSALATKGATLAIAGCTQGECDRALGMPIPGLRPLGLLTDMRPFYAACDVVVLPSFHEGLGQALIEGGACGKALLGSDIPGIRCVLGEGGGRLVPCGDSAALVQALVQLEGDPQQRRQLADAALARVRERFARHVLLAQYVTYYERLGCAQATA